MASATGRTPPCATKGRSTTTTAAGASTSRTLTATCSRSSLARTEGRRGDCASGGGPAQPPPSSEEAHEPHHGPDLQADAEDPERPVVGQVVIHQEAEVLAEEPGEEAEGEEHRGDDGQLLHHHVQ